MDHQIESPPKIIRHSTSNRDSKILGMLAVFSGVFTIFCLFQLQVLIGLAIFLGSVAGLLYLKWKSLRQIGLVNLMSPKLQTTLLHRSIFDIYRDLVYYPMVTKIVGAFVKGAISKPHPDQLPELFEDLPEGVKKTIFTKGILHLAPERIEKLVIEKDEAALLEFESTTRVNKERGTQDAIIPQNYGKIDPRWDRMAQYEREDVQIHDMTLSKTVLLNLNKKIQWKHIIPLMGLVSFALLKTKGKKMGKIALYNGSFIGILVLVGMIVIKYKQPLETKKKKVVEKQN